LLARSTKTLLQGFLIATAILALAGAAVFAKLRLFSRTSVPYQTQTSFDLGPAGWATIDLGHSTACGSDSLPTSIEFDVPTSDSSHRVRAVDITVTCLQDHTQKALHLHTSKLPAAPLSLHLPALVPSGIGPLFDKHSAGDYQLQLSLFLDGSTAAIPAKLPLLIHMIPDAGSTDGTASPSLLARLSNLF